MGAWIVGSVIHTLSLGEISHPLKFLSSCLAMGGGVMEIILAHAVVSSDLADDRGVEDGKLLEVSCCRVPKVSRGCPGAE